MLETQELYMHHMLKGCLSSHLLVLGRRLPTSEGEQLTTLGWADRAQQDVMPLQMAAALTSARSR